MLRMKQDRKVKADAAAGSADNSLKVHHQHTVTSKHTNLWFQCETIVSDMNLMDLHVFDVLVMMSLPVSESNCREETCFCKDGT